MISLTFISTALTCAIQSSSLLLLHCSLGLARATCVPCLRFISTALTCAIQSSSLLLLHCSLGLARATCVPCFCLWILLCMHKSNTLSVNPPPPPPPQIALGIFLVHVLKILFLLCFRTWGLGGQSFQEVRQLEDGLPEAATPEGPLAPINSLPAMEAYRPLLSQNVLQAGAQSISKGNIQDVHWTFLGRGCRWSWPREQLELEERDAYQNSCSPRSHADQKI